MLVYHQIFVAMTASEREVKARKRVKKKKGFYRHLGTYLTMATFFFVLNVLTSPGSWWFYWPLLGWGIGLASHYISVFGLPGSGVGSADWEQRELAKERERLGIPASENMTVDIDEHLELRELEADAPTAKEYRSEDLV